MKPISATPSSETYPPRQVPPLPRRAAPWACRPGGECSERCIPVSESVICANLRLYPPGVMSGDELRRQRGRLGLTQRALADRVGVGLRTITSWEALGARALSATAEGRLNTILGPKISSVPGALAHVSDLELIAELARRLGAASSSVLAAGSTGVTDDPRSSAVEDYPADATAEGVMGTPKNERPSYQATTPKGPLRRVRVQSVDGDSPQWRHRGERP